ncbi:MAG: bifunctional methylenetetrahydrofolate dehydrogenase/methenyltetrahydrofolate cyclohydrolase [Methanosarcinales archaeon]|nr:bifunctional methylenetetrahydrofolate dehydrogenase/methenyltetrahydrofolate cyclohydrolase [Methanosarcinales archaeon]
MPNEKIIDGRAIAKEIEEEVRSGNEKLKAKTGLTPGLATVLVGDDEASRMYIRLKHKACDRVGIHAEDHSLPADSTQDELTALINTLNDRNDIHSILVQLPLPPHLDEQAAMEAIAPDKDADGFHPVNMGRLLIGKEELVPCTPKGIIRALEEYNVVIEGKNAVIVGHSNVVGKPLAAMLLNRNATVSVCHIFTDDLKRYTTQADILISATGVAHLIKEDMIKEGAIIFDVGISKIDGKVVGDVDYEAVLPKVSLITPVPGGVGPMTISILLQHTLESASRINK